MPEGCGLMTMFLSQCRLLPDVLYHLITDFGVEVSNQYFLFMLRQPMIKPAKVVRKIVHYRFVFAFRWRMSVDDLDFQGFGAFFGARTIIR